VSVFFAHLRRLPGDAVHLPNSPDQFHSALVTERAESRNIPIVESPKGRRDDVVDPSFAGQPDAIVVILKSREPARINDLHRRQGR